MGRVGPKRGALIPSCEKAKRELGWAPKYPTAIAVMEKYLATVPRRANGVVSSVVQRLRERRKTH